MTNEELDRCHYLVQIPANPIYPSLNLAMAVQIMAYEIQMARLQTSQPSSTNEIESVDVKDMERFYEHLETTLSEIEFFNPKNPRKLMRRLRRYFNRSRPNVSEMNILRGILTAAQKKARDNKSL